MATIFNGIDGVQKIPAWVQNGITKESIEYAESFGKYLASNQFSTSQIRNVFSEIKSLQMKGEKGFTDTPLLLLKPKLAYSKARKTGRGSEAAGDLEKVLSKGIDSIISGDKNKYEKFENFANFFEAILAYHKSFKGN
jgi:CRISPR-associated protein Csm2